MKDCYAGQSKESYNAHMAADKLIKYTACLTCGQAAHETSEGIAIKYFYNLLKTDLYRAFVSRSFVIGAAAMLVILMVGSVGMVGGLAPAVYAFENAYGYNNIIQLTFSAAAFAYAAQFASEWQNGFVIPTVIRSSPLMYALSKCVATGLSGGVSIALGAAVFMVYACFASPGIMPDQFFQPVMFNDLLIGHAVFYFMAYLYVIFLQGMFFSVLGLLASGYFTNKYVAYAAPFTLGFLFNRFSLAIALPRWTDPVWLASAWLDAYSTSIALLIETGMFLLYTIIASALFVRIVKRKIANL